MWKPTKIVCNVSFEIISKILKAFTFCCIFVASFESFLAKVVVLYYKFKWFFYCCGIFYLNSYCNIMGWNKLIRKSLYCTKELWHSFENRYSIVTESLLYEYLYWTIWRIGWIAPRWFERKGWIYPILQNRPRQNSNAARNWINSSPPNSSDDLCLFFCINPSSIPLGEAEVPGAGYLKPGLERQQEACP